MAKLKRRKRNYYLRFIKRMDRLDRKLERERQQRADAHAALVGQREELAEAWGRTKPELCYVVPIDFRGSGYSYTYSWMQGRLEEDARAREPDDGRE